MENKCKYKSIFEYNTKQTEYFYNSTDFEVLAKNITVKNAVKKSDEKIGLAEIAEVDLVRHFTNLSRDVYGVDNGIYPLGSCTMKYNPKITEKIAALPEFNNVHPYAEIEEMQGFLKVMFELEGMLSEISGMDAVTLQPCAGAHGEFTGLLIIDKYHKSRGDFGRKKVIIPDTAHGTNPASSSMVGMEVVQIKTDEAGNIDLAVLENAVDENTAAFMLTNPSTLGFFEKNILKIAEIVHKKGALLYYDGANLNPMLGIARPGDMGFDVLHINTHKTFATPHGGGGAGSGPVGVKAFLKDFLPHPRIKFKGETGEYILDVKNENSIGRVRSYFGNFQVLLKTYIYILMLGAEGLKNTGEISILNANYLLSKVKEIFNYPFGDKKCMHEFVISCQNYKSEGIKALDIAKRMIDYGIHPPTIYFPLIVHEAMMFEPTETENKQSIDDLVEILRKIKNEIMNEPEKVKNSPLTKKVGRLDDVKAVKEPRLVY